jgi:enamine deaminase RidA (YjgF/YER057c/UK114 family)
MLKTARILRSVGLSAMATRHFNSRHWAARAALAVSLLIGSGRLLAQTSGGEAQMSTDAKIGVEQRLKDLGIKLPAPPEPFGAYAEAVQTGDLLFLSGMLPTEGHEAKYVGRVGAELDVEGGRKAARLAALNGLAVARQYLGSLDRVTRIVRISVSVATAGDIRAQAKVADGASELLQEVFGKDKNPVRAVYGVASLPLGSAVEVELIFEVAKQ